MLDHPVLLKDMTPEHEELRRRARGYFTLDNLRQWRREPNSFIKKSQWEEFGKEGFLGVSLPRHMGGKGLGTLGAVIMNEAFAQVEDCGITNGMHVQNEITSYWLVTTKQEHLRKKYLPEMIKGKVVGCTCDTEPNGVIETTATKDGADLIVTGQKIFIVNGYNSDLCFVSALFEGDLVTVLVEKERSGVNVKKVFDKFGTRTIDSALLEFDHVRVPLTNILSSRGVQQLLHWNMVMTRARFLIAIDGYLILRALIDKIIEYGKNRIIGHQPLISWPINRHAIAMAAADLELMKAGIVRAYTGLLRNKYAVSDLVALKWFSIERATDFARLCTEMQGAAGYMFDSYFLQAYAQLRGLRMAAGSQTTMATVSNGYLSCQAELGGARHGVAA